MIDDKIERDQFNAYNEHTGALFTEVAWQAWRARALLAAPIAPATGSVPVADAREALTDAVVEKWLDRQGNDRGQGLCDMYTSAVRDGYRLARSTLTDFYAAPPANAPVASVSSVPESMGLLRCLQYVECVYRLNFVAEGEPSSTLKYMQDVIAANAPAPTQGADARSVAMTNGDFHCPACGEVKKGPLYCGSCLWQAPELTDSEVADDARPVAITEEHRTLIENAILALDEGVAPGSEHANDLRCVLNALATRDADPRDAPARVEKTTYGPALFVNGVRVREWLGTMYNEKADAIAAEINAAAIAPKEKTS